MGGGTILPGHSPIPREKILAAYRAGPDAIISLIHYLQEVYEQELRALRVEGATLSQQVKQLQEQLRTDSHNSSKPPSSDGIGRKIVHTRKPTGKKPGGQKGHEGSRLPLTESPDQVVVHAPRCCGKCGASLEGKAPIGYERRQEIELPPIKVQVTEHRAQIKVCGDCGAQTRGAFPEGMNSPVQYGPRIRASLIYVKDYALLPFHRAMELMQELFGVPMSAGTLANIEQQCSAKLEATVGLIKEKVSAAEVGHFDETGMKINGKLFWLHVAGTTQASYYFAHARRGTEAMEAMGILPGFNGIAVHDFWSSYLGYPCLHGLCNAHLVRELTFIWEEYHQKWAQDLIDALLGWKQLVEQAKQRGRTGLAGRRLGQIEEQYRKIIMRGLRANPPPEETGVRKRGRKKKSKARNLVERMRDYSEWVLRFVHDFRVPFTNNLAERDLRMMKVQQKISGTFRSSRGAVAFCRIRSYIATSRKMGLNVIESLSSVFNGEPALHKLLQTT
jgi:transposase